MYEPRPNRSSEIQCFECSDAIEIHDGTMFVFYPGLPHPYSENIYHVDIYGYTCGKLRMCHGHLTGYLALSGSSLTNVGIPIYLRQLVPLQDYAVERNGNGTIVLAY